MLDKISIIVPIFNAENYLEQCLDSIVNQSYSNLEILLINDGSTDASAQICETYVQRDSRVKLVHKKLGGSGVGATRNTALSYVTGDYILFVDNDDWIEKNHVETLYNALKEFDADISVVNFSVFDDERKTFLIYVTKDDYIQKKMTIEEWFKYQYEGEQNFSQCFTVPWCKLYKAELFKDIIYPEDEKVEDDFTTWKVYLKANNIVLTNTSLYNHRRHSCNTTKLVNKGAVFPLKTIEERIAILSLLNFDISNELDAYKFRLNLHKEQLLLSGNMMEYYKVLQKISILEKYGKF